MLHNSATQTASMTVTGKPFLRLRLSLVRNIALLIVTTAVLIQLAIFFSIDNLVASALVLCGTFLGFYYSFNQKLLDEFPISTLMIGGYTLCHFAVPPVGKLAGFEGILHGLNHSILVWVYALIGLSALVLAHYIYRVFSPCWMVRWSLTRAFYRPLHFFEMPDRAQLWLMGIVGIGATLLAFRNSDPAGGSAVSGLARVLVPLIYVPYLTSFPTLLDPRYETPRQPIRLSLIAYTVVLVAISAMVNSRGFMLMGFVSLACIYGYRILTGTIAPPKISLGTLIIVLIGCWLAIGPMANLAASMLVARKMRGRVSSQELARQTWDIYRSGTAANIYELSLESSRRLGSYNEAYYNNIFLNRFGNVRFTDLSIDAAHKMIVLGRAPYFRRIEFEKVVAVLPSPAIKLLHLELNKEKALSGSSEDFLYELATGSDVGGFKAGEVLVIMRATFGLAWPIGFGLLAMPFFLVTDASCDMDSLWEGQRGRFDCVVINSMVAGTIFNFVFYLGGVQDPASFIAICTRNWISMGILYGVVFIVSKWISSLIFGGVLRQPGEIN